MVSGPVLVESRDGSVRGGFSEYHLMNTNVRVNKHCSVELDQVEEEEIRVCEVASETTKQTVNYVFTIFTEKTTFRPINFYID
ncbi:hypothetical protein FNV43_RR17538 [Rhamnella rubrinervis]|uniref:Uncharacterized protein n=1 Tax=Rhamnella rubrinervis TaxID=2594499 RepID=A0A8K0DXA7_9ROSA|nr:hypothetical protein FNV43_RR17538 [Rhamnella rubrinervis]